MLFRSHGTKRGLAMTTDCTPRYCYADPVEGGKQAVAETYRNLSAVGAKPLAITNCLNFANPQRPEIMAQIVECLRGMGDACRALDYPIVSGNVSLYNESKATGGGSAILPTPAIGGVGIIDDHEKMATIGFKAEGEVIWVLGEPMHGGQDIGQSLWLRESHGREAGTAPLVDLIAERRNSEFIRSMIAQGQVTAVHDISDGGLAVALTEMALAGGIGADVQRFFTRNWSYFSENQARYIFTTAEDANIQQGNADLNFFAIGRVGGTTLKLRGDEGEVLAEPPLTALREASDSFFRDWMES